MGRKQILLIAGFGAICSAAFTLLVLALLLQLWWTAVGMLGTMVAVGLALATRWREWSADGKQQGRS